MIFDRRPIPPGAPPEMHDLVQLLATAAGPADTGIWPGRPQRWRRLPGWSPRPASRPLHPRRRPARRRRSRRPARARLPMAAALVTATAGLASITAAYAGVLPGPIQQMAHVTVGAPAPPRDQAQRPSAVGKTRPSATHHAGTFAPRPTHSTVPSPVPGSSSREEPRSGRSGPSPRPAGATCTPLPSPIRTPVSPGPVKSPPQPGAPGWTPRSPGAANCPDIATQNAVPHPYR